VLVAWLLASIGCLAPGSLVDYPYFTPHARPLPVAMPASPATSTPPFKQVQHQEKLVLEPVLTKAVPITLDAVLRIAEQHNPRIKTAREKLNESQITSAQGSLGWLPNIYAGFGYYRHEGGIQDFGGRLLHSSFGGSYPNFQIQSELNLREGVFQLIDLERRIWQQRAELSQVNNEVLLDAALTYVDLLAARRGEVIAGELQKYEQKLLDRAEKYAQTQKGASGVVDANKATMHNRLHQIARLKQQGDAASAKLVYLLGLAPCTSLVPMDTVLAPIELVDTTPAVCDLVMQAMANGPGIRELEGLITMAHLAMEKTCDIHNCLPTIQFNLQEGPFGAGPGGSLAWDNRLDVSLGVRWNLTQLCQTEVKRSLIRSRQTQTMLSYEDLKGKLAAGVTEARGAILSGREQIGYTAAQVKHANESYRWSDERLKEGVPEARETEVMVAIRSLEQAHVNYIQAITDHNKAQIRLLMYLGCTPASAHKAK
jgi:outer membrane protein TolC